LVVVPTYFSYKRKKGRWKISQPPTATRLRSVRPQLARLLMIDVTVVTGALSHLRTHAEIEAR
jgi:hypothetical protein